MSTLLDEIQEEFGEAEAWSESLEDELKRRRAEDQSRLAYWIIKAFLVFVTLLLVFVLLSVLNTPSDCEIVREGGVVTETCSQEAWRAKAEFMLTVISSVMLPVVTLVLGFYFGSEKGKE